MQDIVPLMNTNNNNNNNNNKEEEDEEEKILDHIFYMNSVYVFIIKFQSSY
jgi:hypothetical protein